MFYEKKEKCFRQTLSALRLEKRFERVLLLNGTRVQSRNMDGTLKKGVEWERLKLYVELKKTLKAFGLIRLETKMICKLIWPKSMMDNGRGKVEKNEPDESNERITFTTIIEWNAGHDRDHPVYGTSH